MTTTADREERWRHSRHLAEPAIYPLYLINLATTWLPHMPRIAAVAITVAMLGALAVILMHERELCERCISRIPLDPQKTVNRYRQALRAIHHPKWLLGSAIAPLIVGASLPQQWWETKTANSLCTVIGAIALFSVFRHQRLQPWCPFCRRDDGDDTPATIPDPVDGNRKPVPA